MGTSSSGKAEKNVNIDRFKLGHSEYDDHRYSEPSTSGLGACAIPESSDDEVDVPEPDLPAIKKVVDINGFEDELSPSKEKNNCLLDNSRKINKANVDLVFHRNNLVVSKDTDAENQISTVEESSNLDTARGNHDDSESDIHDEVAIAKMTAYLNQQH